MATKHDILFNPASMELGKIQWYLLKAFQEMQKSEYIETEKHSLKTASEELTPFGIEVGPDEIHWWVFKREDQIDELQKRTKMVLDSVQKLKVNSSLFAKKFDPSSYDELLSGLAKFTAQNGPEIHELLDYATWLNDKSIYAPIILFSRRIWSTTRRSWKIVPAQNVLDDDKTKRYAEFALGVRTTAGYVLDSVYNDIKAELYDYYSDMGTPVTNVTVPGDRVFTRATREILSEFAAYFEQIRDSLRYILTEIEECKDEVRLLHNEQFWERFVKKAMSDERVENHIWDFKNTLEIWYLAHMKPDEKAKKEIEFSEHIAGYANSNGGVLIIGISDNFPRKVIGLNDLENKISAVRQILARWVQDAVPIHYQQIKLKNDANNDCNCLIMAIAETKFPIEVKNEQGWSLYPRRIGPGKIPGKVDEIRQTKSALVRDSYNYVLSAIDAFVTGK